jgi:ketosteroid isomerase-like protein
MPDKAVLDRIRAALDSGDVDNFASLLAPDVTWGAPGSTNPPCTSDRDDLKWYQRGFDRGVRGRVVEVSPFGDNVLVGMMVSGSSSAGNRSEVERWQVLALSDGLVNDIRGFEHRGSAVATAERSP